MITKLPLSTTMLPQQVINCVQDANNQHGIQDLLCIGYYNDDELFVMSSRMDKKDALWLAHALQRWIFGEIENK